MATVPTPSVEVQATPTLDHPADVLKNLEVPSRRPIRSHLMIMVAPVLAAFEFVKQIWSPGLKEDPTLSCIEIRNGGQHRY